ncbi:uncharacterized protein B0H18DRAFT_1113675 [Fomitopsis serialis]|uniref:uncharacterized protein n=1 Tax=Fomitopsis serialis TaxID=139415 RepID=UPI002007A743|nr:uncharacterized protein B0H18DRAFT_1113675 [Neoantrodia serialis]KAH9936256.1 hypothetical protein B0H18DRAFT_1113675 [Neoantrodia serialis]
MPTVSSSSAVRTSTGHFSLALRARHVLVAGTASENVRSIKGRLPEGVDVILDSDLVIALSGVVDTVKIPGHVIERSAVARHILDYLRVNAGQLGLSTISNLYVDEDDGRAKFSLSSSRPLRAATEMVCLRLVSIDVGLACKMVVRGGKDSPEAASLFSGQAYLPLFSALDDVLEKFVSNDLVRRYPLIFGPWREVGVYMLAPQFCNSLYAQKLDLEARLYPSLSRSLMDIARSSPDPSFKRRFWRSMDVLGTQHDSRVRSAKQAMRDCLGDDAIDDGDRMNAREDSDMLRYSMETLFRRGTRPVVFKGLRATAKAVYNEDDDDDMFDLSGYTPTCTETGFEDALDDEDVDPWPAPSDVDEDPFELDSDEEVIELWSTPQCSLFMNDDPEEDVVLSDEDLEYRILSTEDDSRDLETSLSSTNLLRDTLSPASQVTLFAADEDEDVIRPSQCNQMPLGGSQQSSGSDDDFATLCEAGLEVWAPPGYSERHSHEASTIARPDAVYVDRDLLLDWCDDGDMDSDDLMVPSQPNHDAWLSTGRFDCRALEAMDLNEDDCLLDGSYDDIHFDESTETASGNV